MAFTIRAATVADARAIAEVHVDGWRWGYRNILPAAVLDALDVAEREARWAARLAEPRPGDGSMVAIDDAGGVIGFAATGPADADFAPPPEGAGELFALYLLDGWQGRGVGRELLDAAQRALECHGFEVAVLWVFEANARARRVYERGGWGLDGAESMCRFDGGEHAVLRYRTG